MEQVIRHRCHCFRHCILINSKSNAIPGTSERERARWMIVERWGCAAEMARIEERETCSRFAQRHDNFINWNLKRTYAWNLSAFIYIFCFCVIFIYFHLYCACFAFCCAAFLFFAFCVHWNLIFKHHKCVKETRQEWLPLPTSRRSQCNASQSKITWFSSSFFSRTLTPGKRAQTRSQTHTFWYDFFFFFFCSYISRRHECETHFTCQPLVPMWRAFRMCAAVSSARNLKSVNLPKTKTTKNWIENLVVNCHSICRAFSLSLLYIIIIIIISTLFEPKSRVCGVRKRPHVSYRFPLSHISWVRQRDTENKMSHFYNKIVVVAVVVTAVASIPHFYLNFVFSTCKMDSFYPFFRWLCEIKNKTKTNFRWTSNI